MQEGNTRGVEILIDGEWRQGRGGKTRAIYNPATEEQIGQLTCADESDLEDAARSALRGFNRWSNTSARERASVLARAAALLRQQSETISCAITSEQGKPLYEARLEVAAAVDVLDWFSGEAIRIYGRIIPARQPEVMQQVIREPVGPVAAFTPWNFPVERVFTMRFLPVWLRPVLGGLWVGAMALVTPRFSPLATAPWCSTSRAR